MPRCVDNDNLKFRGKLTHRCHAASEHCLHLVSSWISSAVTLAGRPTKTTTQIIFHHHHHHHHHERSGQTA